MLNVDEVLLKQFPDLVYKSRLLHVATATILKKILHQNEINQFIQTHQHLVGLEFLDAVLDHFDFSYRISNRDRMNIPDQGRVIITANHPVGSLDGLALIKLISEVRPDVKIVATTMLSQIEPLRELLLSVNNFLPTANHIRSLRQIVTALNKEQAVIIFPTGEVSRIRPNGIRDGKWKSGFIRLARKTQSPVLPVHVQARNSVLFYSLSTLYKPLGTLMLVNEMFNKQNQEISFRVGKQVPFDAFHQVGISDKKLAKMMKKQVYGLRTNKSKNQFPVIENIVHPANRKLIRNELMQSEKLGETQDGKHIYLFDYRSNSSVMREIGRLRELSFRQVKEGTGKSLDLDDYDRYYRHLVLWDDRDLEIVGAYRIGECLSILVEKGIEGLYCNSLFEFEGDLIPYLNKAIELGRSFIQPRYWGKRSLDYLWYGIGAYLKRHPEIEYMVGPVSLSASYPVAAQQKIIEFYASLFGRSPVLVRPRLATPFKWEMPAPKLTEDISEQQYKSAYRELRRQLDEMGVKVPALFKQYVELCQPGGCEFLGFNVDPEFANCIDAMILVHIEGIYLKKRQRYIETHAAIECAA